MVVTDTIRLDTKGNCDIKDLTREVEARVSRSKLKNGIVTVFATGSTGAITTVEYEPGLVRDIGEMLDRIVPRGVEYHHDMRWHDGNGHSHVRASLMGPSLTVPFVDGRLKLGTWQQIIFLDFDNRPRSREIVVQVMGE